MKILALINAHALAHVTRPLEIAKVLRQRGHEIIFAGDGKYLEVATLDGFETQDLPFVPIQQIVEAIRAQKLNDLYKKDQLTQYIASELELYKKINPDLLLIDCRLTAITSGEIAGIKRASIVNVHMSSYKSIPYYTPRSRLGFLPEGVLHVLDKIETRIESLFYDRLVMGDINKIRAEYGLPKKNGFAVEEGELILLPDTPQFSPATRLTKNTHFIGPLTWHNQLPPPKCLEKLDNSKRTIYFTIGSDGFDELLNQMDVFSDNNVQIVFAMGKKIDNLNIALPDNVFLEEFINTDILFQHCDIVVCHGGNGTIYQALSFGLPIVGIATHEEQLYGLKRLNQLGLGKGFSSKKLKKEGFKYFVDIIMEVLNDKNYRKNAQSFQSELQSWQSADMGADLIENYFKE